ncbi:hypothetical protein BJ508DRAFT_359862 [Ascobolus immersus RN42]|uniref:Uncharacterized protein n=1 Tax=Ascobolus immersus RN42 TaxID=1160509 RepID=A0A3N4IHJ8_ASCIM|nr:hypothetical protein BJ508DRAFT_359862 [Ascobolus immersus RN42]
MSCLLTVRPHPPYNNTNLVRSITNSSSLNINLTSLSPFGLRQFTDVRALLDQQSLSPEHQPSHLKTRTTFDHQYTSSLSLPRITTTQLNNKPSHLHPNPPNITMHKLTVQDVLPFYTNTPIVSSSDEEAALKAVDAATLQTLVFDTDLEWPFPEFSVHDPTEERRAAREKKLAIEQLARRERAARRSKRAKEVKRQQELFRHHSLRSTGLGCYGFELSCTDSDSVERSVRREIERELRRKKEFEKAELMNAWGGSVERETMPVRYLFEGQSDESGSEAEELREKVRVMQTSWMQMERLKRRNREKRRVEKRTLMKELGIKKVKRSRHFGL